MILAIRGPGIEPGDVADPVGLVDVLPTVLTLAGLEAAEGDRGRSLLDPRAARAIFAESIRGTVSVRTAEGRLILPRTEDSLALVFAPAEGAWVGDDANRALPWTEPAVGILAARLAEVRP